MIEGHYPITILATGIYAVAVDDSDYGDIVNIVRGTCTCGSSNGCVHKQAVRLALDIGLARKEDIVDIYEQVSQLSLF